MGSNCNRQTQTQNGTDYLEQSDHVCSKAANYCFPLKRSMEHIRTKQEVKKDYFIIPAQPQSPGSPVKPLHEFIIQKRSCPTRRNGISIRSGNGSPICYRKKTSQPHQTYQEHKSTQFHTQKQIVNNNSPKMPKDKRKQKSSRSVVATEQRHLKRENHRITNPKPSHHKPKEQLIINADQSLKRVFLI